MPKESAQFPNINAVISSVKKVFLKAPSRIATFRENLPKTPLPPQPVLTRWGAWLQAAVYYADHLDKIQRVIQTFDEEDAVSMRESMIATSSSTVVSDLVYVKSYFGNLPGAIVSPEARDLPLIESVMIVHAIQEGVKQAPGPVASSIATKLEQVLQRNPGWRTMGAVSEILGGQSTPLQEISLNSSELSNLKLCPLTSCEVERSFSNHTNILSDHRTNFTSENLEKYIVIQSNVSCL